MNRYIEFGFIALGLMSPRGRILSVHALATTVNNRWEVTTLILRKHVGLLVGSRLVDNIARLATSTTKTHIQMSLELQLFTCFAHASKKLDT